MRNLLPIFFELLLFYFLIGHVLLRQLLSRRRKRRLTVKEFEHHVGKLRQVHGDLLPSSSVAGLDEVVASLQACHRQPELSEEEAAVAIQAADARVAELVPAPLRRRGPLAEYLEIIVVALGVAFGIRAVFLQPFKIPTGSMQPTLYGIHFVAEEAMAMPNPALRLLGFLHHSRRYVDQTIEEQGMLLGMRQVRSRLPFFPRTAFVIGSREYVLPGTPENAVKCSPKLTDWFRSVQYGNPRAIAFAKGETLARGYLVSGDHVFVNRTVFNFHEPKRGDITVFTTDGIVYQGGPLRGRYYIKRLVGLPGDELKVDEDGRLWVREAGAPGFVLVDEGVHPAFGRIYGKVGGYHGYVFLAGARNLAAAQASFVLPDDAYFMLGDNSPHSLDSRFWGVVPRANLVGKASLIWWPASRRWGPVDTVEPDVGQAGKVGAPSGLE